MFMLFTSKCSHYLSPGVSVIFGCRKISKLSRKEYIYGISPCFAAVKSRRRKISKIYLHNKLENITPQREHLQEIIREAKEHNISTLYKSSSILDKLCMNRTHQNVVMEVGKLNYKTLENDIKPSQKEQFWLALDQIHDPMNLGAILRSAVYFGVDRVIVSESNCCSLTPAVSKASSGAMEWMPAYSVRCLKKFLKRSISSGWDVIGSRGMDSELKRSVYSCDNIQLNKPAILVVGNEGFGLEPDIVKLCTQVVTVESFNPSIPLGLDSLNVSVATGIMLHTLLRSLNVNKKRHHLL